MNPHTRDTAVSRVAILLTALLLALFLPALPRASAAASIQEVTGFGSNPGALKMFRYVPDGLPSGRPVVVALHGCTQNASGYGTGSGWTQLADRWGFSVVLPQQTTGNNASSCFNWFETGDIARGQGEAASVAQMVDKQVADAGADASRVYVTGLSAGGAMTSVMMATYPEKFAAGGVVAGLPYGCAQAAGSPYVCMYVGATQTAKQWGDRVRAARAGYTGPWPRLTVLQGSADYTVKPVNMTDLMKQWTDVLGADQTADTSDTVSGYPHQVFRTASGATAVETYSITGMGHGQPVDPGTGATQCGTAGAYILDVNLCAAYVLGQSWGLG
ncbi:MULTISPECIES: PHB depolymerase family esterase [unclassified Streptomyces]|uniref:extracellular catalytic domain type 1 short-chain-length polyhydroxyalkanoate depolymerase n=1 Tax=unclassified Streptomyces TaxID=2593676 RepID=UPI000DB96A5D|nr:MULTISPECIES: PHB depolymerase family esterase [unclassified Streptomyces]MYT71262.1 PHB depolymerase family esterase [Streptomyces sp. SID8367]RAJ72529.1 poly(hydroxyalkanoate) depolymerase family esterase [Streptomyces sp. PsTaAH-137]